MRIENNRANTGGESKSGTPELPNRRADDSVQPGEYWATELPTRPSTSDMYIPGTEQLYGGQ